MSKGYMGPGTLIQNTITKMQIAGIVLLVVVVVGIPVGCALKASGDNERKVAAAYSHRQYNVGDLVRTKVGKLRGTVTRIYCYEGCSYTVRFPVATMQPQYVAGYEIEADK